MVALWIVTGIILIIIILLNCPVTADLSYENNIFNAKVKFLFYTFYPVKDKPKKKKKEVKRSLKKNNVQDSAKMKNDNISNTDSVNIHNNKASHASISTDNNKGNQKESFLEKKDKIFEKIAFFKTILESAKNGLRRIIKGIYISDISLNFTVADEDACKAAINYGNVNMVVYNAISFLRIFFTISIKKINIVCKYNSSESKYDGRCVIKLRPATALLAAISIICHYLINTKLNRKRNLNESVQSAN